MSFTKKLQRFYEPAMSHAVLVFVMGGISAVFGTSTGYFLIYITRVFSSFFSDFDAGGFWGEVWYTMGIFVILICCTYLLRNFVWIYPQFRMEQDLSKKYFDRFVKSDNLSAEKIGTGRLISILTHGIERWSVLVDESVNNIYRWIVLVSFSAVTLGQSSSALLIGFLIVFAIIAANTIYFSGKGLYWRVKRKEITVEKARIEAKIIMSKFEILQNKNIERETTKIHGLLEKIIEYAKKSHETSFGSWQTSRLVIAIFMIIICYKFYVAARTGGVTRELLADFGVNMGLMATFATYFSLLIEYYINFTKDFVHVEKLWDTFDSLPPIKGYDTGKKFLFKRGNFLLKNCFFHYNKGNNILSNFNLKVTGGKKTALVGHSGSGKTTLMKLLAGYMRPTSGQILIDGQDITKIRLDSYYPHIGYLTQDPSVFDGTIEENLLYGLHENKIMDNTKKDKKIIDNTINYKSKISGLSSLSGLSGLSAMALAIELAECQFIYDLEEGIHTEIGERGIRLSGGQKQRLAIAKIFLKNPEIILLDEPTAALDSYSEQKVAKAFEHLFRGRTVIVIAHRLQTVKSADDIIVLDRGEIVERGTHEELIKLGGKYAGMVDLQSGRVIEDDEE